MMHTRGKDETHNEIAQPILKKMRWPFPIIWIVPIAAAVAAGYYVYSYFQDRGTAITVSFDDGSGLRPAETPVNVNGVQVGQVDSVELGPDHRTVLVHLRLNRDNVAIATHGAQFWIVRPAFAGGSLSGLDTIVSGPYVAATAGTGKPETEFVGLKNPPVTMVPGLHIVLHSQKLEHLQTDSAVYYRGIQVGAVQSTSLSGDSKGVEIGAVIWPAYAVLVRPNTQFWSVSGADIKGGIFTGVEVKLESIRSLLAGGVTFATPDDPLEEPAPDGMEFTLHDDAEKGWLDWSPRIPIQPDDSGTSRPSQDLQQVQKAMGAAAPGN